MRKKMIGLWFTINDHRNGHCPSLMLFFCISVFCSNNLYLSIYGRALFDHFCRHSPSTQQIAFKKYTTSLPTKLARVLFQGDDPSLSDGDRLRVDFRRMTMLFPKLREIQFSDIDLTQMTRDARRHYVQWVTEYLKTASSSATLRGVEFRSGRQEHIQQNRTLSDVAEDWARRLEKEYEWSVDHKFENEDHHRLGFHLIDYSDIKRKESSENIPLSNAAPIPSNMAPPPNMAPIPGNIGTGVPLPMPATSVIPGTSMRIKRREQRFVPPQNVKMQKLHWTRVKKVYFE